MIKGNDDTRFGRRLESLFWWTVRLLPIILLIVMYLGAFKSETLWQRAVEVDENTDLFYYANPLVLMIEVFGVNHQSYFVNFIFSILGKDGILPLFLAKDSFIFLYFCWLVGIELVRFFLNFLLFIVRFANTLFEKMCR